MQGKKIDYEAFAAKLPPNTWLSGKELETLWGVDKKTRSLRAKAMCTYGYMRSKGNTSTIRYRLRIIPRTKPEETSKKNNKNSLDSLIAAAAKVGTENEILKTGLLDAKAAIERALKAIT